MAGKKNNATPSWSGYNHQGQVGIFLALNELNKLIQDNISHEDYSVQFEKEDGEDIDIVHSNKVISRHQVKAKTTSKNLNDYSDVLTGFNIDGVDKNFRYLHTICEVIGFGLPKEEFEKLKNKPKYIPNSLNIKLYKYPDGIMYCELNCNKESKIDTFCKKEIINILKKLNSSLKDDDEHIEETLFGLKDLLCSKIRKAHEKGKEEHPIISFQEIYYFVTSTQKRERQSIHRAKTLFKLFWNESLNDVVDDTDDVDDTIIIKILNLADDDFQRLLIDLHPDRNISQLQKGNNIDNLIDEHNFKYILYSFIIWCKKENFILDNLYYQTNQDSFRLSLINVPKPAAGDVKKRIMKNIKFIRASFDTKYLINMHIDGTRFFEDKPTHEEGKEKLKSGLVGKRADSIFSSNLEYIDCVNTIEKLREDQHNDV